MRIRSHLPTLLASCLALSGPGSVKGQLPTLPFDSIVDHFAAAQNMIDLNVDLDYNSNSIYNELPFAILLGGFISRDLRERNLDAVHRKSINRAGYLGGASLTWIGKDCFLGHVDWRPIITVAAHEQMGMKFADDLFELTFFGNAGFEGEVAELGPSRTTIMGYQTVGAGVRFSANSYVRLDVVNGRSTTQVNAKFASLFTEIDGRELRASINGEFYQSDTAGASFGRSNGLGAALSGAWSNTFDRTTAPITLTIEVQDFGFIRWNGNAVNLKKDTVILFEGIRVTELLDLDNALSGSSQLTDTFGLNYRTEGFTSLLPFLVKGSVSMELGERWKCWFSLDQRNLHGYVPQVAVGATLRMGNRALVGADLSYGGFGGLRIGLGTRIRLRNNLMLSMRTPHVLGFSMGTSRGVGASVGLSAII